MNTTALFRQDDAGRSKSRRPKQRNDCTVRALALVMFLKYDRAFDILKAAGRKNSRGFDIERFCRKNTLRDGLEGRRFYFRLNKIPLAVGTKRRYRVHDFLKDNPEGVHMVGTAGHVFAVLSGVAYDDLPWHFEENRPVYCTITPTLARLPLWQVYAIKRPISRNGLNAKPAGGRLFKRAVAIVEGVSFKMALMTAGKQYEWALKKGEDFDVVPLASDSQDVVR